LRARDLDQMFPIIDPKAKPTAKPKIFVSLLWKQLNHLGYRLEFTYELIYKNSIMGFLIFALFLQFQECWL